VAGGGGGRPGGGAAEVADPVVGVPVAVVAAESGYAHRPSKPVKW
jgi:hypothetical protein